MDNTILAAIIGIVGSFIGGWLGARATRKATEKAFEQNLLLQDKTQKETIRGVLLGLKTEISTLTRIYEAEFLDAINNMGENDYFNYHYPLYQSYFTIFHSNASYIGQIEDDELRELIILTYMKAKGLIDTHLHNNEMLSKKEELNILSLQHGVKYNSAIETLDKELIAYAPNFRINYEETKHLAIKLFASIDAHLPMLLESHLSTEHLVVSTDTDE